MNENKFNGKAEVYESPCYPRETIKYMSFFRAAEEIEKNE
jgi:hypothetical protein